MGKKLLSLLGIVVLLTAFSIAYVVGGTQAYSQYLQANGANQRHCSDQAPVHVCVDAPSALFSAFYPSYVTSNAPLFLAEYSSSVPMTLSVTMSIVDFTSTDTHSVQATPTLHEQRFMPPLLNGVLNTLTLDKPTLLRVLVTDLNNHTTYYKNDIPLTLHSRWLMQWTKENRLRIGAWVTPSDHTIADMVVQATKHLKDQPAPIPSGMVGYNGASPRQVTDQVDALYDTLRDYKIRYVNATVPYDGPNGNAVSIEDIKLPFEVLKQRSGMCIELTVLLASAVEKIGLHAEIIVIPGHAFLGVSTKADDSRFEFWDAVDVDNNVAGDSANVAADQLYAENIRHHTVVDIISIHDARSAGINQML